VRVDSAPWIGLSFDRLELRPGALLRVYGPLLHEVVGPFASGDRGQLVIPTLAGDTAVVELYWPQQYHDEMPSLRLGTVFYGTEGDRGAPASESAHRDGEGVAAFLEGWQAAQATTYVPSELTTIPADEGIWVLGDTVSEFPEDCGETPHRAEIFSEGGDKILRLISNDSFSECADNIEIAYFNDPTIPIIGNDNSLPIQNPTFISFEATGELTDPQSGFPGCVFPPCGDTVSLRLEDNHGNAVAYVLQRAPDAEPAPTTSTYTEIFLDPDAGSYARDIYEDFSMIPGFNPVAAEIRVINFRVNEHGSATLDDLAIGSTSPATCLDADEDGYAVCDGQCTPAGTDLCGDCDDSVADINPGAPEVCGNGVDEDCDGLDLVCQPFCPDEDLDGYAVCDDPCDLEPGDECGDCDDTTDSINPAATEICGNGADEDCDGSAQPCPNCPDFDDDGYAVCDVTCTPAGDDQCGDCDNTDPARNPGAEELCGNGLDEDCSGADRSCSGKELITAYDFESDPGIRVYYNDTFWRRLHSLSPEAIAAGDLDGNDLDELIIDFGQGPGLGLYIYYNNATWSRLHGLSPQLIATGGSGSRTRFVHLLQQYGVDPAAWPEPGAHGYG
jgi:hypothetical protein